MTVDDGKTVGLSNNWTFSAWVKNALPPMSNLRSTLFRGHYTQGDRDYDRFIVVRGSDRMLCFYDGDDRNGNNRYRSTGYEINPLNFSGWHHFAATAGGSRTNFYIDGKFVGDADRREQSTVKFIGNSSSNELFAEYLDDVRIYGVSLNFSEIAAVYGGGFGDQYPSVLLRENSARDTDPRSVRILIGKDSVPVAVTGFETSDWDLADGTVLEMNQTADGNYSLSLDLNDSFVGSVFSVDANVSLDNDGKPNEPFREEIYLHELVYDEAHLVSRWAFDEANGSRIRDLGIAFNDGYLVGNSVLVAGKFGNALSMDGSGDYMSVPRFSGTHKEGNFTISAWVQPTNLGYNSDVQDASIFGTDGNSADTVLVWYNVNGVSTANRTFTFNIGSTSIGLNRLDGPDGLALQDRWQHVVAVMSGQGRKIYHNGLLVADAIGSDNIVTIEGNNVRVGAWSGSGNLDYEGLLDEVRFYNRSFTDDDVAILYGGGNGDLGLTPVIKLNIDNSASTTTGRVEFFKFGQAQIVNGLSAVDFQVNGGVLSNLVSNGNGYDFDFTSSGFPALVQIGLPEGSASLGASQSRAVSRSFVKSPGITAEESLVLWYTFDDLNASKVIQDFSGNQADGLVSAGTLVPGKFANALLLNSGEYLEVDGELLSLSQTLTLSLWAKVLDDSLGVLASNDQFLLRYDDSNLISGLIRNNSGWGDTNTRLPSGRWVHYLLSYDGSNIHLYLDGRMVSETDHTGYLAWGNGGDHNLYLNKYANTGWEAKAVYDELRVYNRGLTRSEVDYLWSSGAGDLGLSPLISGEDPFYRVPSNHSVSFIENNQTVTVAGLVQGEVNATNGTILTFDSSTYGFDLNVTSSPLTVRVEIPQGAVTKDGNLSSAGAFEFRRRIITSVEEDLLAWYPMDERSLSGAVLDVSGRMRHGTFSGRDATVPGAGNVVSSASHASYPATNAFDDGGNASGSRWLINRDQLPVWVSYDFSTATTIHSYSIQSQHINHAQRAPKDWTLKGSDDNNSWTTIDSVTNQAGWGQWEKRTFELDSLATYRYYKLVISNHHEDTWVGVSEIEFLTTPHTPGMFGNALDLNGEYVDLPFKIDQGGTEGMSLSAWIYPQQIDGGTDNERMVFGTDNGGWDWSMSVRMGSLSAWTGSTRYQSPLNVYPNHWYHCVAVFNPTSSRTTLHLNGGSITTDSLDLDGNSNLIRLGSHFGNRTFDGLLDDVRVWGRPLDVAEVKKLWGNGMGDLGPNARIELDDITWSDQIAGKLVLNQTVDDFNASQDLQFSGVSLTSIIEESDSNGTIYNFVLTPADFIPGTLSISLAENSITNSHGVQNPEVSKNIDFRPHRVRESDLLLWWELNASNLGAIANPSTVSGLQVWFDANDTSSLSYDGNNTLITWQDKSGNNYTATTNAGQPEYNPIGGPGGKATVEFRRTGGNDALSIGGTFFAKDHFYVFRSMGANFDYYGGILGHTATYPNSRSSNYLFENQRTYFHSNKYPSAVFRKWN
jgi:hypothetical protein